MVLAEDAALADACATRLGNEVQTSDEEGMLYALEAILRIEGVDGALVIVGDKVAMQGKLPQLVKVKVSPGSISRLEL